MVRAKTSGRVSKKQSRAKQKNETKKAPPKAGPSEARFEKTFEKIYRLVLKIPRGRVMTYGQIARLLEDRYSPRLVGWAMHATPQDGREIPWHRVVNSRGGISTGRIIVHQPDLQRLLLEAEGVVFDERGHLDLSLYQWSPVESRTEDEHAAKSKSPRAARTPAKKTVKSKTKKSGKKN
ncbi:MAG: MGMT family protein [Blastocatellia bacterium]|nr:MGMT family protein [Blastocatellia bacterium]